MPAKPNRRQTEVAQIIRELRSLRKQYKQRRKGRTTTTIETLRSRLKSLQNAESSTKRRRTGATKQTSFVQNSYNFTKAALEGEKTGALKDTKKEIEAHFRQGHSDHQRDESLGECSSRTSSSTSQYKSQETPRTKVHHGFSNVMGDAVRALTTTGISHIHTNLHPDKGKKIIMVELVVQWKERCEEAYHRTKLQYQDISTAKDGVHGFYQ